MSFRQRRIAGWIFLLTCAAAGALWLLRLDYGKKISTDVLELIPPDGAAPEVAIVRALASQAEARTMLLVLTLDGSAPAPVEAAQRFAAALARSPAFAQAIALADPSWRDAIGRELFARRFELLFPTWLAQRRDVPDLPRAAAAELKAFLETPEALAFQDLVPADPLLLLPGALRQVQAGLAVPGAAGANANVPPPTGLVWAQLRASPLAEEGQGPAFAAIAAAAAGLRGEFPRLHVAYTGVNRFAAASRARIEAEVPWLNALSAAAVLLVAWVFIPGAHRALHLLPVIGFAVLGAWVVATMAFERLHVIVLVLGALLTGVAIDYGFYLYMQPPAAPGEDYGQKVRRLVKPLLASCGTTVVGFALLLFSELPMIRQLGVFVGAGLLCALGAAIVYFGTVANPYLPAREFRGATLPPAARRNLRRALVVLALAALPGLLFVTWRDDVRELEVPQPELKREDARIRAAFGEGAARTIYLTTGPSLPAARAALGRFEAWLRDAGGNRARFFNLGPLVPTPNAQREARSFVQARADFPETLRAALRAAGFDEMAFAPFFDAYASYARSLRASDSAAAEAVPVPRLAGPPGLLVHVGAGGPAWFVTVAENAPAASPPGETQTITASQLQSLNRLFAQYRSSALRLSLIGLALVGCGVLLTYGLRDGARIFAIPCGACLAIFGLLGWLGQPLNLFHLLGAFLGVCLTHNYSIFSATSAYRHEPPPVSVRLSALTTAASFGVLALSGIPVVRALGTTVALMVVAALIVIELEHLAPLGAKPR